MPTFRRPSLLWPLLVLGLGALLLLQVLGYLPASIWAALAQLWPVALIVIGLELLIGRSRLGAALVIAAGVALVAGSLTWAAVYVAQLPPGGAQTLAQAPQGATRLSVTLRLQAGAMRLATLGPSDSLMAATAHNGPGETAQQAYTVNGGEGRLTLTQQANPLFEPFLVQRRDPALWDVRLSPGLPLTLTVSAGDAAADLDLTGLQLTSLDLTSGLGQTAITLPASLPAQASLHTGLGPVTLNLPAGTPVRLSVRSGLAYVYLPATLAAAPAGSAYTTANFDPTRPFLDLTLTAGLGGVTLK